MDYSVALDAIIPIEDKIVLIKRKKEPFKGFWALPGSLIQSNKLLKDEIVDIIKEKIGIDAKPFAMLGVYDALDRDPRKRVISIVYICAPKSFDFKPGKDVEEVKTIAIKDIVEGKIKMAFDHRKMIESYAKLIQLGKKG